MWNVRGEKAHRYRDRLVIVRSWRGEGLEETGRNGLRGSRGKKKFNINNLFETTAPWYILINIKGH